MKKVLGLDLGTTSIGWAYVEESEAKNESRIIATGVRVVPLTTDEKEDFTKGRPISVNADRTLKRGARRNNARFKLRRDLLLNYFYKNNFIKHEDIIPESGSESTHEILKLRSQGVEEQISLKDFCRVLLTLNKKRGYKSSRKANIQEEGEIVDGMEVAKILFQKKITPSEYSLQILKSGKKKLPDYYRSDLVGEFIEIWNYQSQYYEDILNDEFKEKILGRTSKATAYIFSTEKGINPIELKGKRDEKKLQTLELCVLAKTSKLELPELVFVFKSLNDKINKSSGYLGAISDRSKNLYFNGITVGQYLYNKIKINPHISLKNLVFYRQDYIDEFEKLWQNQSKYHSNLTDGHKKRIRDYIIYYQRNLKSQKHLLSNCEFEPQRKVIPKSSPLFQEFRIWQNINNLSVKNKVTQESLELIEFDQDVRNQLFEELNSTAKLTNKEVLKILMSEPNDYDLNFNEVQGNRTFDKLLRVIHEIITQEGNDLDIKKLAKQKGYKAISNEILGFAESLGIKTEIFDFDAGIIGNEFDKQSSMLFWHLLYAYIDDNSNTGITSLKKKLHERFGIPLEYTTLFCNIALEDNYGSLSSRAIRKILPHLKSGLKYDKACLEAGYKHSSYETKEEKDQKVLDKYLTLLPKNALRNPVVEKIINQMVNVVNAIIDDKQMGAPDEIRIEVGRELKANADQRKSSTSRIMEATKNHEKYKEILKKEFGLKYVNRNDIIKYKLYLELKPLGYKTLYTNRYISKEDLFSPNIDIEHIIPKSRFFDDSFSNKTLSFREINLEKGNQTALDYIRLRKDSNEGDLEDYRNRVNELYKNGISKTKKERLLTTGDKIPSDFLNRDLGNTQYISKKAMELLKKICRNVYPTTGKITNRLRSDWDLINVMKELNWEKYDKSGLTQVIEGKNGQRLNRIVDWSKRNDHRHHAMDAITVAFTKQSIVQYLNNLNARSDRSSVFYAIEKKELYVNNNNKLLFKPPMQNFRSEVKHHLKGVLISFKTKNKVTTNNINKIKIKGKNKFKTKTESTPRGQLHKETIYGKSKYYKTAEIPINSKLDKKTILTVANSKFRNALLKRLALYNNNPKKAFSGSNSIKINPIYIDEEKSILLPDKIKIVWLEDRFTIKKPIAPDLKLDKVIDPKIRIILKDRLAQFNGNKKDAFTNLEENPIWLNKKQGIQIKRVKISGVNNAEPLHHKKDHFGNDILDSRDNPIDTDYVQTGNNHHVAIYQDEKGKLQEEVVSFYEAVIRKNMGLPVIKRDHELGWNFLFTMKQNEMFIIPKDDFDPTQYDLKNPDNYALISPYLFRIQKISTKNYLFTHHLETEAINGDVLKNKKSLIGKTHYLYQSTKSLENLIKVRINHLGNIVQIGEY